MSAAPKNLQMKVEVELDDFSSKEKKEVIIYQPEKDKEEILEEVIADPGCCDIVPRCVDDPFSVTSDKTIQRIADIYLPIPGASFSLGGTMALAAQAPSALSGALTLFGATSTIAGKVMSSISDRRMLKQPIAAAREAGVDEEELSHKGFVESSAYYANRINLGAAIVSGAGVILGVLFLFGVLSNETKDDTYSAGGSSSSFGNSSIFGILLNGVTLIDNCLKILKGCEIEYRDRIVQLSKAKAHEKQEEESQKQTQEHKTWLPEILQRRQEIREMVAKLKALVDKDVNKESEEIAILANRCERFLIMLNRKYFDLEIKRMVSDQLSLEDSSSFEPSFLNELKQIEEEFKGFGQNLHNSLSENEHCNSVMTLWEKVSISPPLYKIEVLEEYLRFFNSGIEEQTSFTQEEKIQFKNTLSDLGEELASAKDRLTNTIKLTLDRMQKEQVEYDMQALKDRINELDNHGLEPRLSRSSFGKK